MKPPRRVKPGTPGAEGSLASSISVAKAGRLVALLRGEGLTQITVQELLTSDSAVALREILTDRVHSGRADHDPGPVSRPVRSGDGKLLAFKAKE